MPDYVDRRLLRFARALRREMTDAERRLWLRLRSGQLCGHKFRRQHPIEPYIADFYCHDVALVVELDGSQHTEPAALAYDLRRTQFFEAQGLHVVRYWDHDVLRDTDTVLESILLVAEERRGRGGGAVR